MSGSDDLGGLGELDDGGDDLGGLDGDDLGGLDDDFDDMDGGDDMAGGGGGNVDELEHRLDELENEVGSLSSTVNTVRNENEQISNSVEEVEENVRKLLDIYEMVTRGVNPFADEMDGGMGMGGQMEAQDSSFGLFTDDEEQEEESVDEDIADADAEGFFDDDLVEDEEADDFGEVDETESEAEVDESDEFDEMGDDELFDDAEEFDDAFDEPETVDDPDDEFEEMGGDLNDDFEEVEETTQATEPVDDGADLGETEPQSVETDATASQQDKGQSTDNSADGKPYLRQIPDGFTGDLVVVEWLEYLVDEVGARGASEAIRYYETIDWVTEEVADELEAHLGEFERGRRGALSTDHHTQSLAYIDQLNGGEATQAAVFGGGESP